MVPNLLWRCPLCHVNDALIQKRRLFRPDHLRCTQCHTLWEVKRVVGQDYRLRVLEGDPALLGQERALNDWYDQMRAGFRLTPIVSDDLSLEPGEELYLTAENAPLIVGEENPLLTDWAEREPPMSLPTSGPPALAWRTVGVGRLDMTNQRLLWQGNDRVCDFWWRHVNSVFTWTEAVIGIMYGAVTYRFRTPGQSILKWLTYADYVARLVQETEGHTIFVPVY